MNIEELKQEFNLLLPSERYGYKRPTDPISSGNDFFLNVPQLIPKDHVIYSTLNLILSVLLSNDRLLQQWYQDLEKQLGNQDFKIVTEAAKGLMSPEMLKKLNGIADHANNYVHPATHPAAMITQDATHRFATDAEKNTWNAKASTATVSTTANGLAPRRDGNSQHFLAGDGIWREIAWSLITGKPSAYPTTWGNVSGKPSDLATQSWVNNLINTLKNNGTLGGIAGGNLAQNGWVKFTNGLLLQWGTIADVKQRVTEQFPVAFSHNMFAIAVSHYNSQYEDLVVEATTKTNAIFYGRGVSQGLTRYIVVGN